jgi:hypothetical protein
MISVVPSLTYRSSCCDFTFALHFDSVIEEVKK